MFIHHARSLRAHDQPPLGTTVYTFLGDKGKQLLELLRLTYWPHTIMDASVDHSMHVPGPQQSTCASMHDGKPGAFDATLFECIKLRGVGGQRERFPTTTTRARRSLPFFCW